MVPVDIRPYWTIFPDLVAGLFSVRSLAMMGGLSAFMAIASFMPFRFGVLLRFIAFGMFAGYFFLVLRRAAAGETTLPRAGDFSNAIDDIFLPAIRLFLATAILWGPTVGYLFYKAFSMAPGQDPTTVWLDPVILLILAVSTAYVPGAIIIAAISEDTGDVLNPMNVLAIVTRVPGQYFLTVGVCTVLTGIDAVVGFTLMAIFSLMPLWFIAPFVIIFAGMFIPMLIALILGRLIFQNSEAFGLDVADDGKQPALPDARPRGNVPMGAEKDREPQRSRAITPPPAAVSLTGVAAVEPPPPAFTQGYTPAPEQAPEPAPEPQAPADSGPLPDPGEAISGDLDDSSIAGAMYDPGRETSAAIAAIPAAGLTPFQQKSGPLSLGDNTQIADPVEPLRAALERSDETASVQAYQQLMGDGVTPNLEPSLELRLTQYLGNADLYSDAVLSCRRAAGKQPDGPMAPAATFTAARLMAEKLQQPEQAKALLQFMLDNYPDSPLCNHARQLLEQLA